MKFKRPKYLELVKDKELHSSAWLDTELIDDPSGGDDIYKLVAAKRAIKNFVHILTGDPTIKVIFEGTDSYTDGKTVTIANVIKKTTDFDVTVGLALHEASHVLLTDFGALDTISNMVVTNNPTEIGLPSNLTNKIDLYGYKVLVKTLLNIIEDRRIDAYVYTNAPGYRGYYDSLYHKYFWHKTIDKTLLSAEFTDETIESYLFRLTNITNPNTNLDALKHLKKISDMIGLDSISRFENTNEVLVLADEIAKIIVAGLPDGSSNNNPNNSESGNGENSESGNGENSESNGSESGNGENSESNGSESDGSDDGSESNGSESDGSDDGSESDGSDDGSGTGNFNPTTELTESQKKSLERLVQKQKDFLDGNIKKAKVTKKDGNRIQTVEEAGASTKKVGNGYESGEYWETRKNPTDLIILEKMTKSIINSGDDIFP